MVVLARAEAGGVVAKIGIGCFMSGAGGIDLSTRDVALPAELLGAGEVEARLLRVGFGACDGSAGLGDGAHRRVDVLARALHRSLRSRQRALRVGAGHAYLCV